MLYARSPSVPRLGIACFGSSSRPRLAPTSATVGRLSVQSIQNVATAATPAGATSRSRPRPALAPTSRSSLPLPAHGQVRGKKTRTAVTLGELPLPVAPKQLPQGLIVAEPLPLEDHEPTYPTVVLQARRNMQKFDGCVLLTRVGGFYELYFEQAEEYGPLLNLKVAQKKTNAGPVSMAGFPFFQLDRFLKILVQDLNRHVAIAEEFPNDAAKKVKSGGLLHDRKVARIVTPGTLIDENFMDPYANNYVMAIHLPASAESEPPPASPADTAPKEVDVGLAWLDLSTGYFFTQPTTLSLLGSVLSRVSPREIVLDKEMESQRGHDIMAVLEEERYLVSYSPPGELQNLSDWQPMLEADIPARTAEKFTDNEVKAGGLLLHYVGDRLRGLSMKLQPPVRHESLQVMNIDKNSMRALEIKQTIRDGAFKGSLLHAIRRTVTKSGARLLNEWLSSPSTSLEVISHRQDLVSRFLQNEDLRDAVIVLLRRSHDSQRLVQKFALNRGEPDDLLRLASTIKAAEDIVSILNSVISSQPPPETDAQHEDCLSTMIGRISLDQPLKLAKRIWDAIDEEGLVQQHQIEDSETGEMLALAQEIVKAEGSEADTALLPKGAVAKAAGTNAASGKKKPTSLRDFYGEDSEVWIMKPGASPIITRLHAEFASLLQDKIALTETLRARFNAASLTLRWTPGLGHICHLRGKDARRSPTTAADDDDDAAAAAAPVRTLSSSRTTRSVHQPEWTVLGERLDKARFQIRTEEQRVFGALRAHVVHCLVKLRRNASVLDELDIATSFARLAADQNLTRPVLHDSLASPSPPQTIIIGGRHPTVEGGLAEAGRTFQRNDCLVGAPGHGRAWLITGPNMAGKSTFLRQNALITVLAQVGCYVPADHASLSVVDAIFSRVGSADSLFHNQSTFMVEMLETAAILRQATPRSFVIMDEVGRGTTPEDGAAVAFASLHHLLHVNRCRVLFATHFHDIADLVAQHRMRLGDGGPVGAVEMYCTDVEEDGQGGFVYVHRLRKGINRQSHALKVARLAGLPEQAIRVARGVLEKSGVVDTESREHSEVTHKTADTVG
ncbi:muts domain V-domain-containing protein [Lasiosphaeria hispida]|uniref:Muts domain V-domain-containing protein n=1 Tax=Lasiosphaeria hispida TaxID=260671 RepID=A0AAJ0H6I1_9PEZI|nr:muts domain V-domain-containing protein [Lasiosphaeria hispida]